LDATPSKGIALLCDTYGEILEVIQDTFTLGEIGPGKRISQVLDSENSYKLFEFMALLRDKKVLFDWEFKTAEVYDNLIIRLSGLLLNTKMIILATALEKETLNLYRELMIMNNEQTNTIRVTTKEQKKIAQEVQPDNELYEELSRMNNELINLHRQLAKKNMEQERLISEIKELSVTDPLTNILNRRGFFYRADQEWSHAQRYKRPITAIMFDIDFFKLFNDAYGHEAGDSILVEVAHRCQSRLRTVDILARFGGDEFCALLPETDAKMGAIAAAGILDTIRNSIDTDFDRLCATASIGVADNQNGVNNLDDILRNADMAMYEAKRAGRNQVHVFSPPLDNLEPAKAPLQ
jgi:diguanylate cyclase (GGDEF)-like protein